MNNSDSKNIIKQEWFISNGLDFNNITQPIEWRQFGWGRYNPNLTNLAGDQTLSLGKELNGYVHSVRIYSRPIMTAEAVSNYRTGPISTIN